MAERRETQIQVPIPILDDTRIKINKEPAQHPRDMEWRLQVKVHDFAIATKWFDYWDEALDFARNLLVAARPTQNRK